MKSSINKDWYAIISAILIIGFLLILTVWWFQLVLQEVYDGRGKQNYLKAYAAAEAGLELALYEVRDKGYAYFEERPFSVDIFWDSLRNAQYSFEFLWKVDSYTWNIAAAWVDIIPLFWIDSDEEIHRVSTWLHLEASAEIAWNVLWEEVWVWGSWGFDWATAIDKKELEEAGSFTLINSDLNSFLNTPEIKYLLIINTWSEAQEYTLTSPTFFTLPRHDIISSWKVGNFTQNIRTHLDNTDFLWLLRYSIYAWD